MPLPEFHSVTKEKLESTQPKTTHSSLDISRFVPDHESVELLWENGQVVMQGQSSRPKKNSVPSFFSSHSGKAQDKDGRDAVIPKTGRCGVINSISHDQSAPGPSGHIGFNGNDDEMAPWLNYPIDDYCMEFLSEFTGVNLSSVSTSNTLVPLDRITSYSEAVRDTQNLDNGNVFRAPMGCSEPTRTRNDQASQSQQQYQSLASNGRRKESDFTMGNNMGAHQGPCGDSPTTIRMQKQNLTSSSKPMQPCSSRGLMNFSHFSRPAALVKANLQSVDRSRSNEKVSTTVCSNPMESALIESAGGLRSMSGAVQGQMSSVIAKGDLKSPAHPPKVVVSVEHSEAICLEDTARNNFMNTTKDQKSPDHMKSQGSNVRGSVAAVWHEKEKVPETVVASSSLCSVNGAGAVSSDTKDRGKRKSQEGEESEYQSEDLEDDSVDVKRPVGGRGMTTKRSRAAEVHNLSERRRRDRINEKMRALQELIPNCNKVDKASMLDEAIEYLKTLQMQVQIMSMGSGLCMPPMILPAGMQHIRAPHMGPFSPMGVGMGMGMGLGFRMGMLDMVGSPLISLPPIHGPQFPFASIPGTTGLHGMPGPTSLQMFGIPGQGFPMSMPRAPFSVPLSGFPSKVSAASETSGVEAILVPAADPVPSPRSKDQQLQTSNIETANKTGADKSQIQTSTQATKECFVQSSTTQMNTQTSNVAGNETIDSENGISSDPLSARRGL